MNALEGTTKPNISELTPSNDKTAHGRRFDSYDIHSGEKGGSTTAPHSDALQRL